MKVVFISNFYNYHQEAFSQAMFNLVDEYRFVETAPMDEDRVKMGWGQNLPEYVVSHDNFEQDRLFVDKLIFDADIVIIGSAPISLVKKRVKSKKLTFRYSERIFKSPSKYLTLPIRVIKYWCDGYHRMHLLSASAYAYGDYKKTFCFTNKAYKWGYFPKVKQYEDISELKRSASILWVARLIEWKHPEVPIHIAKKLKGAGYSFQLNMIGSGEKLDELHELIIDNGLQNHVYLLGSMTPEKVRENMEQSQIFLFTSDRNEGWGAVLNEAMNSGCAVVASNAIGSVPYLIENKKNGFIYKDGNEDELFERVKYLLDNTQECKKIGQAAYETMTTMWNADVAAKRLLALSKQIMENSNDDLFEKGPCSKEK